MVLKRDFWQASCDRFWHLWLFKTYALSACMYASQIWTTQFLEHDNVFSNPLQAAQMEFQKRILRVNSTSCVYFENACRNLCNFTGQLPNFGIGWLIRTATLYAMLWKQIFPWGILVLLIVGLDRWMDAFGDLQNGTFYITGSWMFLICAETWDSGIRQFGERHMVKALALV